MDEHHRPLVVAWDPALLLSDAERAARADREAAEVARQAEEDERARAAAQLEQEQARERRAQEDRDRVAAKAEAEAEAQREEDRRVVAEALVNIERLARRRRLAESHNRSI